ncbi:MAG: hypothetical protein LAP87_06970 [Acidobacteriia bacterium]|nr:hypothetical protein [Terriglobia bacterium]
MRRFVLVALLAIFAFALSAARLTLRDGTAVYGQFLSGTAQNIFFQDDHGVRRRFDLNQIQSIDFTGVNDGAHDRRLEERPDHAPGASRSDARYEHDWATLPAGAQIAVRTDEDINSQSAAEGRTYAAAIQQDIADSSGSVIIPRGSQAGLVIRRMKEGGTLSGASLVLDLDSIRVNGRRYMVDTADIREGDTGIGKNKRTAEMVGGGAVLGTLIGAIAGGGKGAAIGAVAGAAAGGGVQVLTKGKEIRVPAETVLNFRLEQPLHLREER